MPSNNDGCCVVVCTEEEKTKASKLVCYSSVSVHEREEKIQMTRGCGEEQFKFR